MTVKLMLTCLCDAFYGEVGIATVRVLEHAGCTVEFPKDQTCCGQPPFNAGDWDEARKIATRWKEVFNPSGLKTPHPAQSSIVNSQSSIVVTPSSSCAAMIREGYGLLFGNDEHPLVYELSEFLVRHLRVDAWPIGYTPGSLRHRRFAYHRACHGRGLGLRDEQERLLSSIQGVELLPIEGEEQCCGFGGAFSVNHSTVSAGIGMEKLRTVIESGAKTLVSSDMGCLMHLRGLIKKEGLDLEVKHFAEILADVIPASVPA
jgi:L-lactate dehydrogenase complex protein LldE